MTGVNQPQHGGSEPERQEDQKHNSNERVDSNAHVDIPVLFDMDGVILVGPSTDPVIYEQAADLTIADLELEPTQTEREQLRTYEYEVVEAGCQRLGVDPATFWKRRECRATKLENEQLIEGVRGVYADVRVLSQLADATTLALVSNNRHETVTFVTEYFGLPFAAVRGRDPTPDGFRRRKPEPDYLVETLSELGHEHGIYVGDRATDVMAAERAGLDGAYLRRAHNETAPLPTAATYELQSLSELNSILHDYPVP